MRLARLFTAGRYPGFERFAVGAGFRLEETEGGYQPCDLAVTFGVPSPRVSPAVIDVFAHHPGPILVIESSILGRYFRPPRGQFSRWILGRYRRPASRSSHYRLAVGGAFGPAADFNSRGSPSDRWQQLGFNLEPYRNQGKHILLLGQIPQDASLGGNCIVHWLCETAQEIRERSDRPILIRLHPGMGWKSEKLVERGIRGIRNAKVSPRKHSIAMDLKDAWVTVSFSSGGAIDGYIAGVPAIVLSESSLCAGIASRHLSEIEAPALPLREQFFYDLAYSQWSPEEYATGRAWHHIYPAVERAFCAH